MTAKREECINTDLVYVSLRGLRSIHLRYDAICACPGSQAEDTFCVCPPDSDWPLRDEVPEHDPTVGISGQQASILPQEAQIVNLGTMTTENVFWLWRRGCIVT